MKPEKLPSWQALLATLRQLDGLPLEIFILKCHLVVEAQMYRLLALRLDVSEEYLPSLAFWPLTKLAFAGNDFKVAIPIVLALNDLRNEFSHELDAEKHESAYAKFCERSGMVWPKIDHASASPNLAADRETLVRAAAFISVASAFARYAQGILVKEAFDSEDEAEDIRDTIEQIDRMIVQSRNKQHRASTS